MIDRDIHLARALLVESSPMLRSIAAAQLRDIGVGYVAQVARVKEARLLLEAERVDIVICNREFEGSDYSGQDLLDELRRERLLPHSTVFVMVTSRASYLQVVEAAESALDSILIRPYTGALLAERLREARNRKRELADVLRALDAGENELALVHAIRRFQEQQPYWLYCGRLAAELLLTLQKPEEAQRVFERLLKVKPGESWVRLGIARAQIAVGAIADARRSIAEVLQADPDSADAHDMLGSILADQCDFDGALAEYRLAADRTPGCLLRAQHAGALAFYQGDGADALRWLERTLAIGAQSKLFDPLGLLLIAMIRYDLHDANAVAAMREQLRRRCLRSPDSLRLQRFEQTAAVLESLSAGRRSDALSGLSQLALQVTSEAFDIEAASVMLAVWARVPPDVRPAHDYEVMIERVGMRYCVSKAMAEVLVACSGRSEPAVGILRSCQARVFATAEQAMESSMQGKPAAAVESLLATGEATLNAKLLELAGHIVRRHEAALPDAQALSERAAALVGRFSRSSSHISGIQRSGRSPGGLQLRVRSAAPATAQLAAVQHTTLGAGTDSEAMPRSVAGAGARPATGATLSAADAPRSLAVDAV